MTAKSLSPLAEWLRTTQFSTPPFRAKWTELSAHQLPPATVMTQYAAVSDAWRNGRSAQAIDSLQKIPPGSWSPALQNELTHKKTVAAQFDELQKTRGSKRYEDALLSFYETLDLQSDGYFVRAVASDMKALNGKALARGQTWMAQAQSLWEQYRTNGGIGGSQRLESDVSDSFRTQARRLSEAHDASTRGMRMLRQVKSADAADLGRDGFGQPERRLLRHARRAQSHARAQERTDLLYLLAFRGGPGRIRGGIPGGETGSRRPVICHPSGGKR